MKKYTPGEWFPVPTDAEPGAGIGGYGVLVVTPDDEEGTIIGDGMTEADATLMAAAPDLLAACAAALTLLDGNDTTQGRRIDKIIRAAIRKATGQRGQP